MGIPWYFYTIYNKYNTENDLTIDEESINKLDIESVFLDYNSMIHPCAQQELSLNKDLVFQDDNTIEQNIIKNCLNYTRYILNLIKPKKLYIMIDGVAPRAKINQQRERRFKSYFFKSIENKNKNENENEKTIKVDWNSNKITPGTFFMIKLTDQLNKFKNEMENDDFRIIISDSNICGEGEHKMMKLISSINEIKGKICIYALDADLIMLSLMNKYADNIILLRDNTFNTKLAECKRVYTYLDINRLKRYICKDLRSENNYLNENRISDIDLIYDYIFLCFLMGNDFLDHIPSLLIKEGGLNVIMKSYNIVMGNTKWSNSLVNINSIKNKNWKGCINLDMLKDIFFYLSKSEDYFFQNIYSVYKNKKNVYKDTYNLDDINVNEQSKVYFYTQDKINYNQNGYKQRYYKFYNIINVDHACENYLTGLYWILGYYNNHIHDNWSWYYPYHQTPFVSDLYTFLSKKRNSYLEKIDSCNYLQKSIPNSTLEQLFMVLPKESLLEIIREKDIKLYEKLLRLFNTKSKTLHEYYPNKIYLEMINKEYIWQSKIFLKSIDLQFFNNIIF